MYSYKTLLSLLLFLLAIDAYADEYSHQRKNMIDEIKANVRETAQWLGYDALTEGVLAALNKVPRHQFVPRQQRRYAYENRPLPIGSGQTISQPYIVAIMTDLLKLQPDAVVFELGTGSGYQAAVLGQLVEQVYSVEIVPELGQRAQQVLARLEYNNIRTRIGDGYFGWPEYAPFDAIIVTAAGDHIPPPLVQQLKPGGRMIMPVGSPFLTQQLMLIEKQDDGGVRTRTILPVRFVPLTGGH